MKLALLTKKYLSLYFKTKEAKLTYIIWFALSFAYLIYYLVERTNSLQLGQYHPDLVNKSLHFNWLYLGFIGGNNFGVLLIISTFASNAFVFWAHKHRNNNFSNYCIQRVGRKEQYLSELLVVVITSAIFSLIMMILTHLVMFLYLFIIEDFAQVFTKYDLVFLPLHIISMTTYTIIFSLLVYEIGFFIKNEYVFRASGMIIYIVLTLVTIVPDYFLSSFHDMGYFFWFGILEGVGAFSIGNLAFDIGRQLLTITFYYVMIFLLARMNYKRISRTDR